jgi:hemerythrin-like domain-containing protein
MEDFKVSSFFTHDHDELDNYFVKFQQLKRTDYPLAKQFFKQFKFGLQRHIVWEEEFLFPLFEQATGIVDGPTQVMRDEHRQIEAAMEAIHKKVQKSDPDSDDLDRALLSILKLHNDKEEHVLYPAIDQAATQEQLQTLHIRMETLPPERYKVCSCSHGH